MSPFVVLHLGGGSTAVNRSFFFYVFRSQSGRAWSGAKASALLLSFPVFQPLSDAVLVVVPGAWLSMAFGKGCFHPLSKVVVLESDGGLCPPRLL